MGIIKTVLGLVDLLRGIINSVLGLIDLLGHFSKHYCA